MIDNNVTEGNAVLVFRNIVFTICCRQITYFFVCYIVARIFNRLSGPLNSIFVKNELAPKFISSIYPFSCRLCLCNMFLYKNKSCSRINIDPIVTKI